MPAFDSRCFPHAWALFHRPIRPGPRLDRGSRKVSRRQEGCPTLWNIRID